MLLWTINPQTCQKKGGSADFRFVNYSLSGYYEFLLRRPPGGGAAAKQQGENGATEKRRPKSAASFLVAPGGLEPTTHGL